MPLGCGCLFALGAASFPRLGLLFTWFFTPLVNRTFHGGFLVPLFGLIFLPFTTLMYVLVWQPAIGLTGWGWPLLIIGFLIDISSYGSGAFGGRGRVQRGYRVLA